MSPLMYLILVTLIIDVSEVFGRCCWMGKSSMSQLDLAETTKKKHDILLLVYVVVGITMEALEIGNHKI